MANQSSDCARSKYANLYNNLKGLAEKALKDALCSLLNTVLGAVKGILETEEAVIVPVVDLADVFVQDFVILPAQTVSSTLDATTSTITQLRQLGINNDCPDHKNLNSTINKVTSPIVSLDRKLKNFVKTAQGFSNSLSQLESEIPNALDSVNNILDVIVEPCQ